MDVSLSSLVNFASSTMSLSLSMFFLMLVGFLRIGLIAMLPPFWYVSCFIDNLIRHNTNSNKHALFGRLLSMKKRPKGVQLIKLRHKVTGQIWTLKRSAALRFKIACNGLRNFIGHAWERKFCVHVVLTVKENTSEVHFLHFNRVITFVRTKLKRRGVQMKYIAVREHQKRGAVHYHVCFFYNKPYQFCNINEIQKSWRLGYAKIVPVNNIKSVYNYLLKYMSKTMESLAYGFKVFSGSQLCAVYRLSPDRFRWCLSRIPHNLFGIVVVNYRKLYIACEYNKKFLIHQFESEWEFLGTLVTEDV